MTRDSYCCVDLINGKDRAVKSDSVVIARRQRTLRYGVRSSVLARFAGELAGDRIRAKQTA